jgi:hypothetical protein
MMLAHYHGGVWSAAEIGRGLQIKDAVARRYLDTLEGVFMVRQLQPWYENISKRQIKSPKIYIRDSGLLHTLLGIRRDVELATHPKVGASWEGYVIEEVLRAVRPDQAYFTLCLRFSASRQLSFALYENGRLLRVSFLAENSGFHHNHRVQGNFHCSPAFTSKILTIARSTM